MTNPPREGVSPILQAGVVIFVGVALASSCLAVIGLILYITRAAIN